MDKILLIEDDIPTVDIYETVLKKNGYQVESIKWGEEGLAKIRAIENGEAEKPDLVLLDILFPDLNGIRILEEIRGNDKTKDLPVFVLTNYVSEELDRKSKVLKPQKHLLKTDCTPQILLQIIKEELDKRYSPVKDPTDNQ